MNLRGGRSRAPAARGVVRSWTPGEEKERKKEKGAKVSSARGIVIKIRRVFHRKDNGQRRQKNSV